MIEPLPWDSELFGVSIGTIDGSTVPADGLDADAFDAAVRAAGVDCVYLHCPATADTILRAAARCGFHVADVRVELEARLETTIATPRDGSGEGGTISPERGDPGETTFALATDADRAGLLVIGEEISRWSRFAHDPGFGADAARRLYERWIDASLADRVEIAQVARVAGDVVGLVTCRRRGEERVDIDLIGVLGRCSGRGIGAALVRRMRAWAAAQGYRTLGVATQARNPGALAFYSRTGFSISTVDVVLHAWPGRRG